MAEDYNFHRTRLVVLDFLRDRGYNIKVEKDKCICTKQGAPAIVMYLTENKEPEK